MATSRHTYIHTHNFRICSHASVGLAQARPNNVYIYIYIDIFIIQLIFLQQCFPIPVPCNITQYCTAWVLLHGCYCTGPGATRYPNKHDVL